ncbi:MAG: hypothetical protein QOC70_1583 [Verrucomicrobiota bacterium]|jgi:hypothetical protein
MSSELKADLEFETKGKPPGRRVADASVRLNPVPAKNTLLTIVFFSAVAVAIGYWILFPPVASAPTKSSATPTASPAAIASAAQPVQRH